MTSTELDELYNALSNGETVTVEFTKSDGSRRVMRCTTNLNDVPKDKHPKTQMEVGISGDVQRAFDLDINAWRSFRYDSVMNFAYPE